MVNKILSLVFFQNLKQTCINKAQLQTCPGTIKTHIKGAPHDICCLTKIPIYSRSAVLTPPSTYTVLCHC